MEERLKGKVAVVTGGGGERGVGRGICLALAEAGASVVVNDVSTRPDGSRGADSVVAEIVHVGGKAKPSYDSVTTMAGGEKIIGTATDHFGRIDILVNCAGNYVSIPALETTEEVWDQIMAVHLKGHFACVKAAARVMAAQKSGRIINFASRGAFFGKTGSLAYATAKAGIMGFTSLLARVLREEGVTVNCILPSADTGLFPGVRVQLGDHLPLANPPDPNYIAPIAVYLCTDAARDITGQFVYAGGGDIVFYAEPLQMAYSNRLLHKQGKWTLDELSEIVPKLMGKD